MLLQGIHQKVNLQFVILIHLKNLQLFLPQFFTDVSGHQRKVINGEIKESQCNWVVGVCWQLIICMIDVYLYTMAITILLQS
jgi:hypothetical protein